MYVEKKKKITWPRIAFAVLATVHFLAADPLNSFQDSPLWSETAYAQDTMSDDDRNSVENISVEGSKKVLWVEVEDFISSGTHEQISNAIEEASQSPEYSAVILALDTPGGSLDATFQIIESIQGSEVPVIGYVYPQGRSAWSAGTIILLASDYASMAPFTTIGSAHPVIGNEPVNDTKVINALTERVASLAELHARNSTQAIRFVTHNDNLSPAAAIDRNIIETIADGPEDLLQKAHNSTVNTLHGPRTVDTAGASIVTHEPSLRVMIIDALANPLISTIFLTLGFFAVIYGLTSPGFGGEIAGAVLIILGLLGQGFDINWGAFVLLAIGVGLLGYELYSPGFGAFGIAGIVVLSLGSALMITQPVRPLLVTEEHIGNLALLSIIIISPFTALMGIITYKAWKLKSRKTVTFVLQGYEGKALDAVSKDTIGFVMVGGEYWRAKTQNGTIEKGSKVRVVKKEGDMLIVESFPSADSSSPKTAT
jgi:membrane-bound serine protease (ClpP class)